VRLCFSSLTRLVLGVWFLCFNEVAYSSKKKEKKKKKKEVIIFLLALGRTLTIF
jgi:hypothetical protein